MTKNKHKNLRFACIIISIIMFCLMLTGCSSDDEVSIKVSDITKDNLVLTFDNDTDGKLRLGWVNSCEIIVETNKDTYYFEPDNFNNEIRRGTSQYALDISDCVGEIRRVEITDLRKLNDRGLPDERIKDIVVYDADKDINGYSGSFPFLSGTKGKMTIGFIIVGSIMAIVITIFVIIAIRTKKSNQRAVSQFNPFGNNQNADTYHDFVIRENNRVQNEMHNHAHQQGVSMHNQAHQHAVDMNNHNNGFNPPPSPPNF